MANHDWSTYVGVIGGVVGMLAGVGGFVLGILAFRRTGQLKALDLRLELRRCERSLRSDAGGIVQLLEGSKASHTRLGAAQGNYRSGAMQHWLVEWGTDLASAESLVQQVATLGTFNDAMSQAELEASLNAVQNLQHELAKLSAKYSGSLDKDDVGRAQLHVDQRAIMQARIERKL
ncbi:MAG: hypothetical protein ACRD5Z_10825 [Bryobacteraceae bacterium]